VGKGGSDNLDIRKPKVDNSTKKGQINMGKERRKKVEILHKLKRWGPMTRSETWKMEKTQPGRGRGGEGRKKQT